MSQLRNEARGLYHCCWLGSCGWDPFRGDIECLKLYVSFFFCFPFCWHLPCSNVSRWPHLPPPRIEELLICFHIKGVSLGKLEGVSLLGRMKMWSLRRDKIERAITQKTTEATARRCQRRLKAPKTPIASLVLVNISILQGQLLSLERSNRIGGTVRRGEDRRRSESWIVRRADCQMKVRTVTLYKQARDIVCKQIAATGK